jgi:hypothetical protein
MANIDALIRQLQQIRSQLSLYAEAETKIVAGETKACMACQSS